MDQAELQYLRFSPPTYQERVDIKKVLMDTSLNEPERALQFLTQIKNPYAFRCGKVAVNAVFSSDENSLRASITAYLSAQKRNTEGLPFRLSITSQEPAVIGSCDVML